MNKKGLLTGIEVDYGDTPIANHYDKKITSIIDGMFEFAKSELESSDLSEQIEQFIRQYKETYMGTASIPKSMVYNLMVVMRVLSFHQPMNLNRKVPESIETVRKAVLSLVGRQEGQKKGSTTRLKVKDECFAIYKAIEDKYDKYVTQIISEIIKEYMKKHPELAEFPRKDDTVKKWIEKWYE